MSHLYTLDDGTYVIPAQSCSFPGCHESRGEWHVYPDIYKSNVALWEFIADPNVKILCGEHCGMPRVTNG